MSLATILIIVALVLAFFDIVLWNAVAAYNRILLTPLAVVFIAFALLISTGGIHV